MRDNGVVEDARGLGPFGHLCWSFTDRSQFRLRAAEYLAAGLEAGQWIEYVGGADAGALREELAGLPGGREALAAGRAGVCAVRDFYRFVDGGDVVDAEATVAARVAATERALEAGFTGFRAVVDATAVVRTPAQRAAFARFELLIDRKMHVLPVSAICAYDAAELGAAAVGELACLHPFVNDGCAPFRLFAEHDADFALAGEVDASAAELFDTTLERAVALCPGPVLEVDARRLAFIDQRSLNALDRHARAHGRRVVLRGGPLATAHLAELLELSALRVEAAGA